MELTELAVQDYLVGSSTRFIRSQCHLPFEEGAGGSSPDFVALDYGDETVYCVEVSAAYRLSDLVRKVTEREKSWYSALKRRGQMLKIGPLCWTNYRTALFVRGDRFEYVQRKFCADSDVSVIALERITHPWEWEKAPDGRMLNPLNANLPPRRAA